MQTMLPCSLRVPMRRWHAKGVVVPFASSPVYRYNWRPNTMEHDTTARINA